MVGKTVHLENDELHQQMAKYSFSKKIIISILNKTEKNTLSNVAHESGSSFLIRFLFLTSQHESLLLYFSFRKVLAGESQVIGELREFDSQELSTRRPETTKYFVGLTTNKKFLNWNLPSEVQEINLNQQYFISSMLFICLYFS